MVSGENIGELCRLLLISLCDETAILKPGALGDLKKRHSLTAEMVSEICSDRSPGLSTSSAMLRSDLDIEPTTEDTRNIRKVCEIVVDRAAILLGCCLAATIAHVRRDKPTVTDPVIVCVDGSLYIKFDRLRKSIHVQTQKCLNLVYGAQAPKFQMMPYSGGSSFGAAVLAAASTSSAEPGTDIDTLQFPELQYLDY